MRQIFLLLFTVFTFAQQTQKVDFIKVTGAVVPNASLKKIVGSAVYHFNVLKPIDTIRIDAKNMNFDSVKINNQPVKFKNNQKELLLFEGFKNGINFLSFSYTAFPKQTMYFTGDGLNQQIWTQGQGKYTSYWFPSFDDMNEKVIFNLQIICPKDFVAISNGVLKSVKPLDQNFKTWVYQMEQPMSSYLLAVAIGNFVNKTIASKSHIPLQMFIQPNDTAKFEPTYRYSKQIFDYLEKEIGVKYPWQIYKQIPVKDFLYAGMENTSCTFFAEDFVVDNIGFNDQNYVNVNAHELAHQWFGDLVTAKSGKHHWLQEGFATYYALLAERQIFGDDYFYHQLYRSSIQLRNAAKTDTISIMNEKASSLSFYQKGAWALHVIRETIGAKAFQKAVKKYLNKYQYQNVTTDDFLAAIKKVAPTFDTENFKKTWLEDYHFQTEQANTLLQQNAFMQTLFETQQLRKKTFAENKEKFKQLLQSNVFYPVKTEILYQIKDLPFEDKKELLALALQTNDIKVRQSVAEFTEEIPLEFKAQYETLLDDASYETKEIALIRLFNSFPESQLDYLEKAKNWMGSNDLGLRTTFLLLTQMAKDFDEKQKEKYFNELVDYTSSKYESSIRQSAISAVVQAKKSIDVEVLKNIVNATTHYKWQFSKFARDYIRDLLKVENYRKSFESLLPTLPESEKNHESLSNFGRWK
jgi:aminopeptidase N